ncbi:MAG TPA: hypothetical protein VJ890_05950 [Vineibacter sp.]|nr:hypothetical protein [Vineibacter sp.]
MAIRILLTREDFVLLANGQTVVQYPEDVAVEVELNLDARRNQPPDPPEADEFLPLQRLRSTVWLAVADGRMSYAIPCEYAGEVLRHSRRLGDRIVGRYNSEDAALVAMAMQL